MIRTFFILLLSCVTLRAASPQWYAPTTNDLVALPIVGPANRITAMLGGFALTNGIRGGPFQLVPTNGLTVDWADVFPSTVGDRFWHRIKPDGTGTVTSVSLTAPTDVFNIAGSPVTSSGTLALTFDTQVKNKFFSGPESGADAAPNFRVMGRLDLPIGLDMEPVTGDIIYSSAGDTWDRLPAGTSGKFLKMGASVPAWQNIAVGDVGSGATLTAGSGLTGTTAAALLTAATLNIGAGTGISVAADSVAVDQTFSPTWSGTHTFNVRPIVSMNDNPGYTTYDPNGTADNRRYRMSGNGGKFAVSVVTDDDGTAYEILSVTTVAGSPTSTSLWGTIQLNSYVGPGVLSINSSENVAALSPPGVNGYVLSSQTDGTLSWIASSGSGTVTSVAMTVPGGLLTIAGSPITTSGTLALTLPTQTANKFFAGPSSGGAATPAFRVMEQADLAAGLDVVPATGDMLYSPIGDTWDKLVAGADGKILQMASGVPSWQSTAGSVNGQVVGGTSDYTFSGAGSMEEVTFGSGSPTFTLPSAGTYMLYCSVTINSPGALLAGFISQIKNTTDSTYTGVPISTVPAANVETKSFTTIVTVAGSKVMKLFSQCSSTAGVPKITATGTLVGYVKLN